MISLILAILSSTLVAVVMRVGESKSGSKMGLLVSNYVVCTLLAGFFTLRGTIPTAGDGVTFSVLLGLVGGFLYLYSLIVFQNSIAKNGVVLSSTFMKLGVLVPTVAAMVVFGEQPTVVQIAGFCLAIAAILVLNLQPGQKTAVAGKGLLILLLLVCGFTDSLTNVYDKMGNPVGKDLFLTVIFFTALVFASILLLRRKERLSKWAVICGIGVGIPNYFSSRFLLAALKTIPATVVFPVFSTGTILLVTAAGALFFAERLDKRKGIAMGMILAALVLLNL